LTVTPLQIARAIGGIAMGGVWHTPHLLLSATKTEKPHEWALNPGNVTKIVDGMYGVVNEAGGTGVRAKIPGLDVCGKTGSAQTASNDYAHAHKNEAKDNSWFVEYAPCHNPEIVVSVLWESAEHGALSAPIARDVMTAWFDKKQRLTEAAADAERQKHNPAGALVSALSTAHN
jgi:penicillin-binding protein 2